MEVDLGLEGRCRHIIHENGVLSAQVEGIEAERAGWVEEREAFLIQIEQARADTDDSNQPDEQVATLTEEARAERKRREAVEAELAALRLENRDLKGRLEEVEADVSAAAAKKVAEVRAELGDKLLQKTAKVTGLRAMAVQNQKAAIALFDKFRTVRRATVKELDDGMEGLEGVVNEYSDILLLVDDGEGGKRVAPAAGPVGGLIGRGGGRRREVVDEGDDDGVWALDDAAARPRVNMKACGSRESNGRAGNAAQTLMQPRVGSVEVRGGGDGVDSTL
ncbi:hypothetical protein HDV00_008869 [Rhizophlyctis rosea]|nr:hypothetical protein HDV00_008869 [Rhizophlyctis rosea]